MIAHQHVAVDALARPGAHLPEGLEERRAVGLVEEDRLPPIAPAQDMVKGSRIFDANTARHSPVPYRSGCTVNPSSARMHGLTPPPLLPASPASASRFIGTGEKLGDFAFFESRAFVEQMI